MKQLPIEIIGAPGSPYTQKMLALLRYRRIDHRTHWTDPTALLASRGLPTPKVALLPTLLIANPQGEQTVHIDSTPIIRDLETTYAKRRVRPDDPALAMLDALIEDFADEWCTKLMFHYRWRFAEDADFCAKELPLALNPQMLESDWLQAGQLFAARQVSRLRYVGSNDVTAPIIEAAYERLIQLFGAHIAQQPFLLGKRPAAADFALYGQLSQLALFDPTPRALAHRLAPRVVAWTTVMADQSGIAVSNSQWQDVHHLPSTLVALLGEIGHTYVPLLLANGCAVAAGEEHWHAEIAGAHWEQQSFPYQAKCLMNLRQEFSALSEADQKRVHHAIDGTGCEALFSDL